MPALTPHFLRTPAMRNASFALYACRALGVVALSVLLACGGGGDPPDITPPPVPTPTITLSAAPSTVTASSSTPGTVAVSIVRGGGFAGAVSLSAESLPTGVTASFASASLAPASSATTLTLNAGPTAVAGVSTIAVRATGSGVAASVASVQLTVTVPSINLTSAATALTLQAGGTATLAVALERLGGFTGAVSITADGLPPNVTASFSPTSFAAGATASTLTIAASAGAAAGTTPITVRASAPGVADRTLTLQLTVQSAPLIPISITFCDQTRIPEFFAVRDGTNGAWRVVTPTGNTYAWTFAGNFGSFALVWENPLNRLFTVFETYTTVFSATSAELAATTDLECYLQPARGKSLSGVMAPVVAASELAFVSAGWGNALLTPGGTAFSLPDVAPGGIDLLATRFTNNVTAGGYQPSQFILRRGVNLANGASMPTLDFASNEAFTPATATVTVQNLNGERASVRSAFNPVNSAQLVIDNGIQSTATTHTQYGFPLNRMLAGEMQEAMVTAVDANNTSFRQVVRFTPAPVNQTLALGPPAAVPTLSMTNGVVARPRVRGPVQPEYNKSMTVIFTQPVARKQAYVQVSAGYLGAATTYDIEMPDLLGVPGFNPAWGFTVGSPMGYSLYISNAITPYSNGFPGTFTAEGATFLFSGRNGIMP